MGISLQWTVKPFKIAWCGNSAYCSNIITSFLIPCGVKMRATLRPLPWVSDSLILL